jgi:hypothetical protein
MIVDIPVTLTGIHHLNYQLGNNALMGRLSLKILPAESFAPQAEAVPASGPAPTPPPPEPPPAVSPTTTPPITVSVSMPATSLKGDYEVRVYRSGVLIAEKTQRLLRQKSLLIGKFSASKVVLPDIDLHGHFPDIQSEKQCSRRQAKVYWSEGRIVLQNEGKSPLTLPDGRQLSSTASHDWQPGEAIGLPGGLSLRLEPIRD